RKATRKASGFFTSNLYRSQATPKLELVADTNTDSGGLDIRRVVYVLGIGANSVYVGALGQGVGVTQAVGLLLLEVILGAAQTVGGFAHITHSPRGHNFTRTDRSAQANSVVINTQAFVTC